MRRRPFAAPSGHTTCPWLGLTFAAIFPFPSADGQTRPIEIDGLTSIGTAGTILMDGFLIAATVCRRRVSRRFELVFVSCNSSWCAGCPCWMRSCGTTRRIRSRFLTQSSCSKLHMLRISSKRSKSHGTTTAGCRQKSGQRYL